MCCMLSYSTTDTRTERLHGSVRRPNQSGFIDRREIPDK
ncbi:hypothetical protein NJ7G_1630 [Natrinema sp. J7-2]|nr:hypothetical protein NJ7G_1630 [Natrinema sp. J7-2]